MKYRDINTWVNFICIYIDFDFYVTRIIAAWLSIAMDTPPVNEVSDEKETKYRYMDSSSTINAIGSVTYLAYLYI